MRKIKTPNTHTLDAWKIFNDSLPSALISGQCLLNALNTWENKQFLVSQNNIVFYLKLFLAKPESVCNILFELIY